MLVRSAIVLIVSTMLPISFERRLISLITVADCCMDSRILTVPSMDFWAFDPPSSVSRASRFVISLASLAMEATERMERSI